MRKMQSQGWMEGNSPEGRFSSYPSSLAWIPKHAFLIQGLGLTPGRGRQPGSPGAASTAPVSFAQRVSPKHLSGVGLPDPPTVQGALVPCLMPSSLQIYHRHPWGGERSSSPILLTHFNQGSDDSDKTLQDEPT